MTRLLLFAYLIATALRFLAGPAAVVVRSFGATAARPRPGLVRPLAGLLVRTNVGGVAEQRVSRHCHKIQFSSSRHYILIITNRFNA